MIITRRNKGYSSKRKYIQGQGFVDSLRSIGSYVAQNKDLIAKPLLGAVGNLVAFGFTEGGKDLITHLLIKKLFNINKWNKLLQTRFLTYLNLSNMIIASNHISTLIIYPPVLKI